MIEFRIRIACTRRLIRAQGAARSRPMRPSIESLENRCLLSAVYPSDNEQYLLELINRARANPVAEASSFGIDLNEGLAPGTISPAAKQPLAMNPLLVDGARGHSQWMLDNDVFQHEGPGTQSPGDRMAAAGYVFTGGWSWGENIGWRGTRPGTPDQFQTTTQLHEDLFVDEGIADRGHRIDMLNPMFREVGVGILSGQFSTADRGTFNAVMATEDFASSGNSVFLTGVAYNDKKVKDGFYTPGEGLGGVTITATNLADDQAYTTTTWTSGGYSLALAAGTYRVTATGDGLPGRVLAGDVVVGARNVKVDITPALSADLSNVSIRVADDAAREEGEHPGSFLITRDGSTAGALTVNYSIAGTALNGTDYAPLSGSAVIPVGYSTVTILVTPVDDAIYDPGKTVMLTLADGGNYRVDSGQASASMGIADNDPSILMQTNTIITGSDAGSMPHVRGFDPGNGNQRFAFSAFDGAFRGGVRVATGDVTGDGVPDIIAAPGPGGPPNVRVINGATGRQGDGGGGRFVADDPRYLGGLFVATGDINGDGKADIITGTEDGPPNVRVFSGADGSQLASFFAYDPGFLGGVRVASGDVTGDGRADVITSAGPGAGPHVKVFDSKTMNLVWSFFAYDPGFTGGVYVASGDVNADGRSDIITGASGAPHVKVFDAATHAQAASFFAYDPAFQGGVRVSAADLNNDGKADILTSAGPGAGPHVRGWNGVDVGGTTTTIESFFADDPTDHSGLFIAGAAS